MGVHGLWELLAPVGRRVSVETLAGKKLAIDASIWMVQFMKAMRDERGEMVRNAHLLGFFRRICKLLYLRTKPVFVFDGGTPALKRRTVIARRRQRENAQAKIRKTAEKLLLNHLKTMRLKELEKDLEDQRLKQKNDAKGKGSTLEVNDVHQRSSSMKKSDKDGCSSMPGMAAEGESLKMSADVTADVAVDEAYNDDDEEMILRKNDKGKKILVDDPDEASMDGCCIERNDVELRSYNQEKLDEMLAASIVAEEDGDLTYNTSSSAAVVLSEEEDGDEDEEMLLPALQGNFDSAVLASLPPSMQLDLLVQMRERLMAENRQKYQKVKKAPEKFSELQIQSYLKTVAFRREIDQVQKAASGRGVGGVQTSRIASEANREFIFSSSFTGDKQVLASARGIQNGDTQTQMHSEHSSSVPSSSTASGNRSKVVSGLVPDESRSDFNDDVETYVDERGRVRLDKRRAMGICMTRDLQRNLELMKEVEPEVNGANTTGSVKSALHRKTFSTPKSTGENQFVETTHGDNEDLGEGSKQSLKDGTSIEISFEFDGENKRCDDDDIFSSLVAGDPVKILSDSASESDWEEGISDGKGMDLSNENQAEVQPPYKESEASYESEVEWEEHTCYVLNNPPCKESEVSYESEVEWEDHTCDALNNPSSCPGGSRETVSKGYLVEEADLQEAIKRSLLDQSTEKSDYVSEIHKISESPVKNTVQAIFLDEENAESVNVATKKIESSASESKSSIIHPDDKGILKNDSYQINPASDSEPVKLDGSDWVSEAVFSLEVKEAQTVEEQCFDSFDGGGGISTIASSAHNHIPDAFMVDAKENDIKPENSINEKNFTNPEPSAIARDEKNDVESGISRPISNKKNYPEGEPSCHSVETAGTSNPLVDLSTKESTDVDFEQNMAKSASMDVESTQIEFTEAQMEEEMLILNEERTNLGDEWRKLERNAESVSGEMFAECQELLQMFGIPFIIAPMEAEAQCAYLELANLVDGVVTDDSDVFLFGGRNIYKNIFDDRKYVETYFMKDVENELGLTREKLIRMALLLGSDYTEGISGIGIVNAIEVVNAFQEEDGFCKFREWIESPDPTILGTLDKAKESRARKRDGNGSKDGAEKDTASDHDASQKIKQIFMDKHRNVSKNWHIPSDFPSEAVKSAYSSPQVDKSTESFAWAKPDLLVLRRLCWEKFGWGGQKSDELLLPVLKEYNKRETQLRIEAFYTFNERFAKVRSKRIKKAVKGITANKSSVLAEDAEQEASRKTSKRRVRPGEEDANTEENLHRNKSESTKKPIQKKTKKSNTGKPTSRQSRKRKECEENVTSEAENPNPEQALEEECTTNRGSRGTGRSRGRGSVRGRGRTKVSRSSEFSEASSSSEDNASDNEQRVDGEKPEGSEVTRRSTRPRKLVNYTLDNVESEDTGKSVDHGNAVRSVEESSAKQDSSFNEETNEGTAVRRDDPSFETPSLAEGLHGGDYLEIGGGFCMEEGETGLSATENQGTCIEACEEYLTAGGGFCTEENQAAEDQGAMKDPANTDTIIQTTGSDFPAGADLSTGPVQSVPDGNVEASLPENSKESTTRGLRAMPFLRKKRRKN